MNTGLTVDRYVDHFLDDSERFARVLESNDTDRPVGACPGWDVARLALHLGVIHRWARSCVVNAEQPSSTEQFEPDLSDGDESAGARTFDWATWIREGAADLARALRDIDPLATTWHPFPVERVAAVWPRRQAHETAIHRWDAETAIGQRSGLDPELASDGIDEYLEVVVPRLVRRENITLPTQSLHIHCTDVAGEWLVWTDADGYHLVREHAKGDAALRGPAEAILLRLWGRASDRSSELSPVGDDDALSAWLALAGM